jgi:hypothetical protein
LNANVNVNANAGNIGNMKSEFEEMIYFEKLKKGKSRIAN